MKWLSIVLLFMVYWNTIIYQIYGINTENYVAITCSSEDNCENSVNNSGNINYESELNNNDEWELSDNARTIDSTNATTALPTTLQQPIATTLPTNINESMITNLTSKFNLFQRNTAEVCTCDLTISQCDINCCCDTDCTQFHFTVFSHCTDHQTKKYDSRYCYTKNFIQRNNTVFVLEHLTDNLFCIAYDNLPPIYSKSNSIKIENREQFDKLMIKNTEQEYTWPLHKLFYPQNFNSTIPYRDGDVVWKIELKTVKPIEFPMSGFTSHCTFRKNLEYLKDINSHCLQTKLSNDNNNLFTETYNNFSVISSPIFFNTTYMSSSLLNYNCPKNICLPIETKYCLNSSSPCNMTKPPKASCINGSCKNIVKKVSYIITHNGTMGIKKIRATIELANVTTNFYQYFHIEYQWAGINEQIIFHRSGNPGYIIGKPIIIGTLKPNTTDDIAIGNNNSNHTNYFLTVPLANKNGDCHKDKRYTVGLGENLKLKCHVTLMTNNFSINSCNEFNEKILTIFFQESLVNVTDIKQYQIYVSKLGNITNNNNISNWNQILLNKMPNKILESHKDKEQIHCLGLTTSISLDILYSLLPKPDNIDNYKIIGIGITLLHEENINWPKCLIDNCTDTLDIDLVTYVKFHDISTPKTYYYAGGPNLDISLPYDFFYPFLSKSNSVCVKLNSFSFMIIISVLVLSAFQ